MSRRIAVVVQRDLLGQLAGFVLALDDGNERTPLAECDSLSDAMTEAQALMPEHRARAVTIDNGDAE